MKQIFNWTVGSFFRTIGRTIAVLMLGGLFYYILSTNGFEFGIKDLFFERVDALTLDGTPTRIDHVFNGIKTLQYNTTADCGAGITSCNIVKTVNFDYNITNNNYGDYLVFTVYSDIHQSTYYDSTTTEGRNEIYSIYLIATTGTHYMCENQNNLLVCIAPNGLTYKGFNIRIRLSGNSAFITLNIHDYPTYYKSYSTQIIEEQQQTTNATQQQTQQQQEQHNQTMNYLQDNNTTTAESDAEGFFGNFTSPDVGGLSAIITAPLNTIRSLLNSQCTNLVLPLPFVDEDITLPCMNEIYTQHFGAFFTIYQTIVLALIAYRCIRSIFFDIHGFTNPNDDRIEVMDL